MSLTGPVFLGAIVACTVIAFVVLVLVLPKTRRHFEFHLRKKAIKKA